MGLESLKKLKKILRQWTNPILAKNKTRTLSEHLEGCCFFLQTSVFFLKFEAKLQTRKWIYHFEFRVLSSINS